MSLTRPCLPQAGVSRHAAAMKTSVSDLTNLATTHLFARRLLTCALASSLLLAPGPDAASWVPASNLLGDKKAKQNPALKGLPVTELSADEAVLHALNRLAYGPRPGDIERVKQMGLAKWIDQQLSPNATEDKPLEVKLERLPTLRMSTATLIAEYPQPKQAAKQAMTVQASADAGAGVILRDSQSGSGDNSSDSTQPATRNSKDRVE